VEIAQPSVPTLEELEATIPRFIGTIEQRPPAYSALKVGGRRAYKLARRGEEVELLPRPVEIYALQIFRYEYPELELLVECGSGTYIRSLGRDLAEAVGTGAVMSQLRRLSVGPFKADSAVRADLIGFSIIQSHLLSPLLAVGSLPVVTLSDEEVARMSRGQTIANQWGRKEVEIAAVTSEGEFVAILVPAGPESLRPAKCFVSC
jgi:tRNA pseudouridine55 synthase